MNKKENVEILRNKRVKYLHDYQFMKLVVVNPSVPLSIYKELYNEETNQGSDINYHKHSINKAAGV